jgi:hypothetical protein
MICRNRSVQLGQGTLGSVSGSEESSSRGSTAPRWQVEKILAAGYGLATVDYNEIEPDFAGGMQYGIRPLFALANITIACPIASVPTGIPAGI